MSVRGYFRAGWLTTAATLLVAGCGGGGGGGGASELKGTISTTDFIVPAGETRNVTGDLTVLATGKIQIDGTLVVTPGANLALSAIGKMSIGGQIKGASRAANRSDTSRKTRDGSGPNWIYTGANVEINPIPGGGTLSVPAGDGATVFVATSSTEGSVTIVSDITTANGEDGSSDENRNGGDAKNIEIGTDAAIQAAKQKTGIDNFRPQTVSIRGNLTTGNGGKGYDDTRISEFDPMVLRGGNGGSGGLILIAASKDLILTGSKLRCGRGGRGGNCGDSAAPARVRGEDGKAVGAAGHSVVFTSGDGGNGGYAVCTGGNNVVPAPGSQGARGAAGSAYLAAGNGGPGGPGGHVQGDYGRAGSGATLDGEIYSADVIITNSGNGGDSTDSLHNGGDGGYITVGEDGPDFPNAHSIQIESSCNGGHGFDCNDKGARPTSGGSPGTVPAYPAHTCLNTHRQPYVYGLHAECFSGGSGGRGAPPGAGGVHGLDGLGKAIGLDGGTGSVGCITHATTLDPGNYTASVSLPGAHRAAGEQVAVTTLDNRLVLFDLDTGSTVGSVAVGNSPLAAAEMAGNWYVANSQSKDVTVVSEATRSVIAMITMPPSIFGGNPSDIDGNPATGKLYVADNLLQVINSASNSVANTITLNGSIRCVAMNRAANLLYAASRDTVFVIDGSTDTLAATIPLDSGASVTGIAVNDATNRVYVVDNANKKLVVVDGNAKSIVAGVGLGNSPQRVALNSSTNRAYATNYGDGTVTTIDMTTNAVVATTPVANGASSIAVDRPNNLVYVGNGAGKPVQILDGTSLK